MRSLATLLLITACGGGSATPGDGAADPDGPGDPDGLPGDGPRPPGDAPPDPCAPDTWCVEDAPVAGVLLSAVWAADLDNVFAVGGGGTILHRQNNAWTAMTSGTTKDLRGVWGLSATDIWAAGDNGALLHYDGAQWSPQGTFTTEDFGAIWAAATDDVHFTAGPKVVHWNGQAFSSTNLPGTVFAIAGVAADDIWATGESAKIDHFTTAWETGIDAGGGATYFGIAAFPGETWVSGFSQTFRFANGSWTPQATSTGTVFRGFHGVSATSLWAAGQNDVGHYDGSAWTVESPAGAAASIFGIGGVGSSFWIVGNDSLILHRRER